jgi:hypothetical protein
MLSNIGIGPIILVLFFVLAPIFWASSASTGAEKGSRAVVVGGTLASLGIIGIVAGDLILDSLGRDMMREFASQPFRYSHADLSQAVDIMNEAKMLAKITGLVAALSGMVYILWGFQQKK